MTKRPNPAQVRPGKNIEERDSKFSDVELDSARCDIKRAFEICGLADSAGNPICPQCGKSGKSREKFFRDGGYKCFSAGNCYGRKAGAVDLVMERLGVPFPEAAALLLGRPVKEKTRGAKPLPPPVVIETEANEFRAVVDSAVYDAVASHGSTDAAVRYYARFGIDREAVVESGAFMIENVPAMQKALLDQFGRERLIACGVLIEKTEDRPDFWVSDFDVFNKETKASSKKAPLHQGH